MDAFDQSFGLLTPNLRHSPPQAAHLVPRPELLVALSSPVPIRILKAPAGSGKSTLAAVWAASMRNASWLTLAASDAKPERFWAALIGALQTCQPTVGERAAVLLLSGAPISAVLNSLVADLTTPTTLVLDDYHLLADSPVHEQLAGFIDRLPAESQVLITSEEDLPLPLVRWLAQDKLLVLKDHDLDWSQADHARLKFKLGIAKRALSNYLSLDVVYALPPTVRDFSLRLSILDTFNADVARSVCGQEDSTAVIDHIVRVGLFLIPLSKPGWSRWHPLFAQRLREYAVTVLSQEERCTLHRRAAQTFQDNGDREQAFEHALQAEDFKLAGQIAFEPPLDLWREDQLTRLHDWLERLPEGMIDHCPDLLLMHAWVSFSKGSSQEQAQRLDAATRLLAARTEPLTDLYTAEELRGILLAQRTSLAARFEHDLDTTMHYSGQGLKLLTPRLAAWRGEILTALGIANQHANDLDMATEWFQQAVEACESTNSQFALLLALKHLAAVHRTLGRLDEAKYCYQRAVELGVSVNGQQLPASVWAYTGMGEIAYEHNDLDQAHEWLTQSLRVMPYDSPSLIPTFLMLARTLHAVGQSRQGSGYLERAHALLAQNPQPEFASWGAVSEGWLALWRGEHGLVWLEKRQLDIAAFTPLHEPEFIFAAYLLIHYHDPIGAEALLEPLLHAAQETHRAALVIEASILLAVALAAQGKTRIAMAALTEAIDLGEAGGYVRTFVDGGVNVLALLRKWTTQRGGHSYAQRLIAAFQPKTSTNYFS